MSGPSPVTANDSGAGLSPGGGEALSSPLGGEDTGEGKETEVAANFDQA